MSALTGEGRDEVIAAMETRLGLDTARISVSFPLNGEESRARVAELYRIGRILRHLASDDEVSIEAEIPRRLLPRFHDVRSSAGMRRVLVHRVARAGGDGRCVRREEGRSTRRW